MFTRECAATFPLIKRAFEDISFLSIVMIRLLDFEVEDAFHERRENAKVLGEEAGTKLLFPMMLMLSIVFALILYAAFQSM